MILINILKEIQYIVVTFGIKVFLRGSYVTVHSIATIFEIMWQILRDGVQLYFNILKMQHVKLAYFVWQLDFT